jgi:hypothetical protein
MLHATQTYDTDVQASGRVGAGSHFIHDTIQTYDTDVQASGRVGAGSHFIHDTILHAHVWSRFTLYT